jgi:hypothetical protein
MIDFEEWKSGRVEGWKGGGPNGGGWGLVNEAG